jgi:hypothetical protein
MEFGAHLVRVLHGLAEALKVRDVVLTAAMTYGNAPRLALCPFDAENTLGAGLVARGEATVLIVLRRCRGAKIADSIIGTVTVDMVDLAGWIFVMMQSPCDTMDANHAPLKSNLHVAGVEKGPARPFARREAPIQDSRFGIVPKRFPQFGHVV